jgi:hypothetical protein
MNWRRARGQGDKLANGPRTVAKHGRFTAEVFEWCSTKQGAHTPCPSGEFSYVILDRKQVIATGPHGARYDIQDRRRGAMFTSREAAQRAAEKRIVLNPRGRRR